jgi:hypothetical protein
MIKISLIVSFLIVNFLLGAQNPIVPAGEYSFSMAEVQWK